MASLIAALRSEGVGAAPPVLLHLNQVL